MMGPLTFDTLPPPVIANEGFPAPPGGRAGDPKFRSPVLVQAEPAPLTVTLPTEAGAPAMVAPTFDTLPPLVIFNVPFEPLPAATERVLVFVQVEPAPSTVTVPILVPVAIWADPVLFTSLPPLIERVDPRGRLPMVKVDVAQGSSVPLYGVPPPVTLPVTTIAA